MSATPRHAPDSGAARIERAIRARSAAGRPAMVAFLTGGFPDRDSFLALLPRVAAVADVVEIGVPFSDPMADGATIQRASRIALERGATLRGLLAALEALEPRPAAPLVLMSYLNPLLALASAPGTGLAAIGPALARAGIAGAIVPDLPLEESDALRAALSDAGVALVGMVTPVTPAERLRSIGAASAGFTYAVTMTGTTGGYAAGGARGGSAATRDDLAAYLDRARVASAAPLCAGFGIRDAAQVAALAGHADGFIVGSALIEEIESGRDPIAFLAALAAASKEDSR
jgi:tryptophan synthase alpha chain